MLLFRVFPYLAGAHVGEPGHPQYLHPAQGAGRLDNPREYQCWYLSAEASGAAGEVFGDLARWSDGMFGFPALPGARRTLGTYEIPDDTPLVDLDDAQNLLDRGLRPTQVIGSNRPVTQAWALRIFNERAHGGTRKWNGVRWWSYHRPQWRIFGLWEIEPRCVDTGALDVGHPAIVDAARTLVRPLR